LPAFYCGGHR
jgi:hypothetical protein